MKAVVIGHGPSLHKAGKGNLIDSYDIVCKFAGSNWQDPNDYGHKTTILFGSTYRLEEYQRKENRNFERFVIWNVRGGIVSERQKGLVNGSVGDVSQTIQWHSDVFKRYFKPEWPHLTRGTIAAIVMYPLVSAVTMLGCDNLCLGTNSNVVEMPSGDTLKGTHDFAAERRYLDQICPNILWLVDA